MALRLGTAACVWLAAATIVAAQAPTAAMTGRVVSDGQAAASVSVRVFRPGGDVVATLTTDADGQFRATGLAQGVYRLEFSGEGFESVTRAGVVVFDGQTVELNISLRRRTTAATSDYSYADAWAALRPGEVGVRVETPLGFIFLAIDVPHAPVTSANFLKYVDGGFYDGGRFHRATRPDNYTPVPPNRPMMELIQGGIHPLRRGDAFPAIPLERTSVTGLAHVRGTLSMARGAPDTATSDFFILLDDQPSLDFGGQRFDDGQGAAAFGRVLEGLETVRRIQQQPTSGQSLTPPVPIVRMTRR